MQLLLDGNDSERNVSNSSGSSNGSDFDYGGDSDLDQFDDCQHEKAFFIDLEVGHGIR